MEFTKLKLKNHIQDNTEYNIILDNQSEIKIKPNYSNDYIIGKNIKVLEVHEFNNYIQYVFMCDLFSFNLKDNKELLFIVEYFKNEPKKSLIKYYTFNDFYESLLNNPLIMTKYDIVDFLVNDKQSSNLI